MAPAALTTVRNKVTLPELPYDYAALEPIICREIMEVSGKWSTGIATLFLVQICKDEIYVVSKL